MNFKEHLEHGKTASKITTLSILAYVVISAIATIIYGNLPVKVDVGPLGYLIIFAACLFGSLFPDLDTASKPSRIVSACGFIGCCLAIYFKEPYVMLYFCAIYMLIKSFPHRTITHMYILPVAFIILALYTKDLTSIAFAIGLVTHYVVDGMNPLTLNNWFRYKELSKIIK